ncbi:MAG: TylF/MycF/NovP-related O-methyltransferase, partial [Nitrososphaerota archaeon]
MYQGDSIQKISRLNNNPESRFFGFDSFSGLPEYWFKDFPAGPFNVGGKIPVIDDNRVNFVKGLFQDTLPDFLRTFKPRNKLIILLDADLYSSTMF